MTKVCLIKVVQCGAFSQEGIMLEMFSSLNSTIPREPRDPSPTPDRPVRPEPSIEEIQKREAERLAATNPCLITVAEVTFWSYMPTICRVQYQ